MTPRERFQRVESIFRSALLLPNEQRERFLATECADETTIRLQVEGMLRADAEPSGALDVRPMPGVPDVESLIEAAARREAALPARIGRYEIVRRIGAGGMGVVYEALQEHPRRSVALKVLHPGSVSRRALQRFRHEAHVLARLQDPGIAQVYEAGVDDWGEGVQPYFAMELIRGVPLLRFVEQERLDSRERLALLAKICDAVHAAHQKGVVHRDLKPANILVVSRAEPQPARRDAKGSSGSGSGTDDVAPAQPKILDFGVARVIDPDLQATTMETAVGQVLGTVAYMSPEQAAGDSGAIDIRSDVYSLGVIAFETLSGRLPFDVRDKPLAEALRIRNECEAPRLGTLDRSFRGDIETVIAKALERTAGRRFASAAEMAADLRRILRFEPIQARRATLFDQLTKLARRNRGLVAAVALAAVGLVAALALAVRLAAVAERARIDEHDLRTIADRRAAEAEREAYRLALVAAASSLRFHEVGDARRQLDAAPKGLRDWVWRHLESRLDDSIASAQVGLERFTTLAFTKDGSAVLATTATGELRRWEVADLLAPRDASGDEVVPVREGLVSGGWRDRWFFAMRMSDEGDAALLTSRAGFTMVDVETLEILGRVHVPAEMVAVSPTGWMAGSFGPAAGADTLRVVRTGDRSAVYEDSPIGSGTAIGAFSPDGRRFAYADGGELGLTVVSLPDASRLLDRPDLRGAGALAFSACGETLAVGVGSSCRLVSVTGSADIELVGHTAPVRAVAFSRLGDRVVTAGGDHTVRIWETSTGIARTVMHGIASMATSVEFSPDGALVVSASRDGTVQLWSAAEPGDPFVLPAPPHVYSVAFSSDGAAFATGSLGGIAPVRVWDNRSARELARLGDGTVSAVAFSPDGSHLAVGRAHGDTTVVSARDGSVVTALPRHWWRTDWVEFVGDGTQLLTVSNGGRLELRDAHTGALLRMRRLNGADTSLGLRVRQSPDRSLVAVAVGSSIRLLDPETLEDVDAISCGGQQVCALDIGSGGRLLASAGSAGTICVHDLETRQVLRTCEGHSSTVYAVALSPDERLLASGGVDRVIRLWDLETGDELVALHGHTSYVYSLDFSPDGETLVSGGGDGTARIWSTRPFGDVLRARSR